MEPTKVYDGGLNIVTGVFVIILTNAPLAHTDLLYRKSRLFLLRYKNPPTNANSIAMATVPE